MNLRTRLARIARELFVPRSPTYWEPAPEPAKTPSRTPPKYDRETADALATLTMAAQENPQFRAELLALLSLPKVQRLTAVDNALRMMEINREPKRLRDAFAALADDAIVAAAFSELGGHR